MSNKLIGFGANTIGGDNLYHNYEASWDDVLDAFFNLGGKVVDTAFVYGLGKSEEALGKLLQKYHRKDIVIMTKAAHILKPDGTLEISNDPAFLKQSVYDALKRLNTNYIDIFFIHFPDPNTFSLESVKALTSLKAKGLIRAIGVSNFSYEQLLVANLDGDIDYVQNRYNLIALDDERDILPYCIKNQIKYIPYTPLARGLLTGKYQVPHKLDERDRRVKTFDFQSPRYEQIIEKVAMLKPLALKYGVEISQIVLAWTMRQKGISYIIPGAKDIHQLRSNMSVQDIVLSDEDNLSIRKLFESMPK